jgi:hypothetical protein
MAAQAVVFQDCRASGVNLKRNLIQTSLGRRRRGFYVLFCVLNVPRGELRGEVCGVSANEYSCAHYVTWSPNKLWRSTVTPYLTYA